MDHKCIKPSNKIRDIVSLHQLLKKWKKLALAPKTKTCTSTCKFLKKTLSFSENTSSLSTTSIPKGCFSICVGEQMKRYVVPTECLSHVAFVNLLREAEEEFGFEQEGVLRILCDVSVFESILQVVLKRKDDGFGTLSYYSVEADATQPQHQLQKSMCT